MVAADNITLDMRTCRVCHEAKPATGFRGGSRICRTCTNAASRLYSMRPDVREARRKRTSSPDGRAAQRLYYKTAQRQAWALAYRSAKNRIYAELRRLHPERHCAREAVHRAIKSGRLIRPETCSRCGRDPGRTRNGKSQIHGHHHRGYAREFWLDVVWLCIQCHEDSEAEHLS